MTLIAEDLLLLLLDDAKGTLAASSYLPTALGGALLVELALAGAVEVEEKRGFWQTAKVRATATTPPQDPLLAAALATVAEKERSAQDLVGRLGKGVKDDLLASLERRGMVQARRDKVLGLFPRTTWPAVDSTHEDAVRRALTAALVSGAEPDDRTRALVALLDALGRAHRTVEHQGMSAGEVRRRAKALADGDWAAKAVKDAIAASTAAMSTAIAAGGVAAAASS
ncbi:GPP34 family phosphoprotein [Nocardioides sp. zg-579]|uniref:GPP34 family phosphoprotein n=1 Tax=Nocardioides marmotae TaxID=2663857 RepID=A0A6I3JGK9_9ACTN|nr:GPP34 family phosphoprotein [Nocardioides marmotae]MCR6033420.1 GPP34 family phosphoprotein [Gordonia jinghuaiqii]MTB97078.1 GPP34 family phosphoprotein [Nocardioides marmotae]QKE00735.1 GPP34 family phosphoprotein [Nocardioides marmotae]